MGAAVDATEIVIPEAGVAQLRRSVVPAPGRGEVLVQTDISIVSTGTELTGFTQRYAPGTNWSTYARLPFRPGYSSVGTVRDVGPTGDRGLVGARVLIEAPHASHHVLGEGGLHIVPDSAGSEHAAWFALAQITFRGFWKTRERLGGSLVVVGAGPIGQLVVRWASVAGLARIAVVDPFPSRLEHARAGGAHEVHASTLDQAPPSLIEDEHSRATIIDTTGNAEVFSEVLRRAPRFGRVVLLGDAGNPADQHLTSDLLFKDLSVVGAFGAQVTEEWPNRRIRDLFLGLVAAGRFPLEGMVTESFAPSDCQRAYERLVGERSSFMGAAFDWSGG